MCRGPYNTELETCFTPLAQMASAADNVRQHLPKLPYARIAQYAGRQIVTKANTALRHLLLPPSIPYLSPQAPSKANPATLLSGCASLHTACLGVKPTHQVLIRPSPVVSTEHSHQLTFLLAALQCSRQEQTDIWHAATAIKNLPSTTSLLHKSHQPVMIQTSVTTIMKVC